MSKLVVPVILGTGRQARLSEHVARFVLREARAYGFESELVDVREHLKVAYTVPSWQESQKEHISTAWADLAERADGFILIVPEYNRGYPGELKLLLDQQYRAYRKKPVALCGVSSGIFGGARVIDHIKPVLIELQMVPVREAAYFLKAGELFSEQGGLDPNQLTGYKAEVNKVFRELAWFAEHIKTSGASDNDI